MSNPVIVPGKNLTAKLAWLKSNAQSDNSYIVEVDADEAIEGQDLSYDGKSNITITLKGMNSKRTIRLSSGGLLFDVKEGITLVLEDNITLHGIEKNGLPLVMVYGNMIMNSGSSIINNKVTIGDLKFFAGGVYVDKKGSFTMNGGTISGNAGGDAGGVTVFGIFTMNDGTISDNNAGRGAGITVFGNNASFTKNGGTISGNIAKSGGGVSVEEGATFIMNEGTISGNTANIGGGVAIVKGATFTMNGGTISGNIAKVGGGGVIMGPGDSNGFFTMNGGMISRNTAGKSGGGGAYVYSGIFTKKGGTITGYASDTVNGNVVRDGSVTENRWGHAVYVSCNKGNTIGKFKDHTAGPTEEMYWDTKESVSGTDAWDGEKTSAPSSSGGCYVATSVYGSYDCPEVWTLRRYRDSTLSTSWFGRRFIRIYYAISPRIVELLGNKKWFNSLWKPVLNKFVHKLQNSGIDDRPYSDV